jgi:hypothetical protein
MPMHNFPLIGEVLLYFILRVEVVKIQISLQIINRFGKGNGILNNKTDCGPKPGRKPSPAQQPSFSPYTGAAQLPGLPSPRTTRLAAQLSLTPNRARNQSSTRPSSYPIRNPFKPCFIPFDLSPKSLIG